VQGSELALLVLIALVAVGASGGESSARSAPGAGSRPQSGKRWKRTKQRPFGSQPEPTDDDLLTPPWDPRYPLYADLVWLQYAKAPDRPGPALTAEDLQPTPQTQASEPRALTPFERWALAPFVPADALELRITLWPVQSRMERWALASMAQLLNPGLAEPVVVGRKLYEQARDFFRGLP
jgi:hypothetical protein